jgi:hypothetical protein
MDSEMSMISPALFYPDDIIDNISPQHLDSSKTTKEKQDQAVKAFFRSWRAHFKHLVLQVFKSKYHKWKSEEKWFDELRQRLPQVIKK